MSNVLCSHIIVSEIAVFFVLLTCQQLYVFCHNPSYEFGDYIDAFAEAWTYWLGFANALVWGLNRRCCVTLINSVYGRRFDDNTGRVSTVHSLEMPLIPGSEEDEQGGGMQHLVEGGSAEGRQSLPRLYPKKSTPAPPIPFSAPPPPPPPPDNDGGLKPCALCRSLSHQ